MGLDIGPHAAAGHSLRLAHLPKRAGSTGPSLSSFGRVPTLIESLHFPAHRKNLLSETRTERNNLPRARLTVIQSSLSYIPSKHLLKTDSLAAQLQTIGITALRPTPLILDRIGEPKAILAAYGVPRSISMELHNITYTREPERMRTHVKPPYRDGFTPPLPDFSIMSPRMHQGSLYRQQVLVPQLLYVNERPLPTAEGKMLYPRESQVILSFHLDQTEDGHAAGNRILVNGNGLIVANAARSLNALAPLGANGIEKLV